MIGEIHREWEEGVVSESTELEGSGDEIADRIRRVRRNSNACGRNDAF